MSIKVTSPLMTICDKAGKPIKGIAKCASDFEIAEKLSVLPPGQYTLQRPPVKILITKPKEGK